MFFTTINDEDLLSVEKQFVLLEAGDNRESTEHHQKLSKLLNRELSRNAITLGDYIAFHRRLDQLKNIIH